MNSSPAIETPAEAPADTPASNPPASTEAAPAPAVIAKGEKSSPTEPLRQNDVAWPVVQATAEAVAQAVSSQKPARKSSKPAAKAVERSAAAKARPPRKQAAKAVAKPAAIPVAKPAAKAVAKPAAKALKKERSASAAKTDTAAAVTAKPSRGKEKPVRDSFTMPRTDYALIGQLKERGLGFKREVRKSELLRAGLQMLAAMDDAALKALLDKLPRIKTGRPRKSG